MLEKYENTRIYRYLLFHYMKDVDFLDQSLEADIGVGGKWIGEPTCSRSLFNLSLGLVDNPAESRSKEEAWVELMGEFADEVVEKEAVVKRGSETPLA